MPFILSRNDKMTHLAGTYKARQVEKTLEASHLNPGRVCLGYVSLTPRWVLLRACYLWMRMKGTLHQPPPDCWGFSSTFCLEGRKNHAWSKSGPDSVAVTAAYPNVPNPATIGADQISNNQLRQSSNSCIPIPLPVQVIRQIEHY